MTRVQARSAVFWSGLDTLARQGLGFGFSVTLARLLAPEDFGTLALLALFIGVANLFTNAGFSAALIQKQETTHVDESTVFWFNLAAATTMTALLIAGAPAIASLFAMPILSPLSRALAFTILISSLGTVHATMFTKRLDFRTPMKIGVVSTIISGFMAVALAWNGAGVWSLAGQSITSAIVTTVLLWLHSHWRPLLIFDRSSFTQLFGFSGWLFASRLLDTCYRHGFSLLIGKLYGMHDLGIYARADNTQKIPTTVLTSLVSRVSFPLFSSVNSDKAKLKRGVRLSTRSLMLINTPMMIGLALVAEPFIRVVFGDKWTSSAPVLQILCIPGLLWPLQILNLNALQAQGHANLFFRLAIVKKSLGILILGAGSFFGITGLACSQALQSVIAVQINGYYSGKLLNYGIKDQFKDCFSSLSTSIAMACVVTGLQFWIKEYSWLEANDWVLLTSSVILGTTSYATLNLIVGTESLRDCIAFFRPQRKALS